MESLYLNSQATFQSNLQTNSHEKYKVLIADENTAYQKELYDYIIADGNIRQVDVVTDGRGAMDAIQNGDYDAVITELVLPNVDGFGILEHAANMHEKSPAIIVVSSIRGEDVVNRACGMGAKYFMVKPAKPEAIHSRMIDILRSKKLSCGEAYRAQKVQMSLDERMTAIFLVIGIPAHIKGYTFLREAIRNVYSKPCLANRITNELYPNIAVKYETSPSKVERAIRHSIELAWSRGKIENINRIFGISIYEKNEKPTNGEFIALIADKLRMEDEKEQKKAIDI